MRSIQNIAILTLWLAGCVNAPPRPEPPPTLPPAPSSAPAFPTQAPPPAPAFPNQLPPPAPVSPVLPAPQAMPSPVPAPAEPGAAGTVSMPWLKQSSWDQLPGWSDDDLDRAWPALLQSCQGLRSNPAWSAACLAAARLPPQPDSARVRTYFERSFYPWQVSQAEGGSEGLVTGYYEPLLHGSRALSYKYRYPVLAAPDDLLAVDLSSIYPELKSLRLRGRLQGNKVVPYYTRAEIESGAAPLRGKELAWVDDPVELFFLQVQGSGRIVMDDGEVMRVGYADQNGYPYRSIGKWLVENGELTLDKASMQGIMDWGRRNPDRLPELLNANPSYVFFRELPNHTAGPLGALGVPLTPERSIAVDPRGMPLGAPVWLATTRPNSSDPLNRLVLAQDTGGAIRGNVRADFFWGFGDEAGKLAGAMKQKGRMWVLLPKGFPVTGNQ